MGKGDNPSSDTLNLWKDVDLILKFSPQASLL